MVNADRPKLQQSLFKLGQLNLAFWHRSLRLYLSGAESFGQRLQRLQTQFAQEVLTSILGATDSENGADNNDPGTVMRAFSDACMEEMRNSEQVALLTFEELQVWFDSSREEWRLLARSTLS